MKLPLAFLIFVLASCGMRSESYRRQVDFWNGTVVDPAHDRMYKTGSLQEARHVFDSLLTLQPSTIPVYVEAARYRLAANYHLFITRNNDSTSLYIDSALSAYSTERLREQYAQDYVNLLLFGGERAFRSANYSKADLYFFNAKQSADRYLDPCNRSSLSYNIAMVSYRQQNYAQSADYFKEAFRTQATCPVQTAAIILQQQEIQSNIGLCFLKLGVYDSAAKYFDAALAIAEKNKDSLGPRALDRIRGVEFGNFAKLYWAQKKPDSAIVLYKQSIALNARPGYEENDALLAQVQLAEVYGMQGDAKEMGEALQEARKGLDTLKNEEAELQWRLLMSKYYGLGKDPLGELDYFKQYVRLRDSMSQQQRQLVRADVSRQLKDREQAVQIAVLKKNNQLNQVLLWVALMMAIMGGVIIYLIYKNNRRNKKNLEELRTLNAAVNNQKQALEQSNQEKDRILHVVAHDLRNPIGLVTYLSDSMLLDDIEPDNKSSLELMREASAQALRLTNELLESGRPIPAASAFENHDLKNIVQNVVAQYQFSANAKGQHIVSEFGALPVMVRGDQAQLARLIGNLLMNAIKFSPLSSNIRVFLHAANHHANLVVEDNGPGIDPSDHARIFDRFTTSRNEGSGGEKSFGLGLSICREIAGWHDGSLQVESTMGKGSRFIFSMPLS